MCDSIAEGGRRCPCDAPEARAARRRAKIAETTAPGNGIGAGGTTTTDVAPTAVASPSIQEQWNPERMRRITDLLHQADPSTLTKMSDGRLLSREEYERHRQYDDEQTQARHEAVFEVMDETGQNTHEGIVRSLGSAVAAEAERRAGVTGQEVEAQAAKAKERKEAEAQEVLAPYAEIMASPEFQEAQDASDAQQKLLSARRWTREEMSATQDRVNRALDALVKKHFPTNENRQAFSDAQRQAASLRQEAVLSEDGQATEGLTRLSHAYTETLSELRPLGGEVDWDHKTSKAAAREFNKSLEVFPSDWVQASNENTPMVARLTKRRAHYTGAAYAKKKVRDYEEHTSVRSTEYLPPSFADQSVDILGPGDPAYEKHKEDGDLHHDDQVVVRIRRWEVHDRYGSSDPTPKPRGTGWQEYVDPSDGTHFWRRPRYSMRTVESKIQPEITASASLPSYAPVERGGEYFRGTTHELCHRFEHTVPGITALESDFLRRRTTDPATGEREKKVDLPGKGETAWADAFPNAYIGRDYGRDSYEVLSMGAESLFSGSNGGLVGAGRYSADPDMRAFILGVMASVRPRGSK